MADGVTFATGKKHSHAAKILTRGFLRNILPQSLVHVNSPRKYDFFQGKGYCSAGFPRRRTSPHHFFSLLQTPLFPLTNFQCCDTSRMLLVVTDERQQQAGLVWGRLSNDPHLAELGQGTDLAARAHREIEQGMGSFGLFFCFGFFFLHNVSHSVNAHVPYMVRKTRNFLTFLYTTHYFA